MPQGKRIADLTHEDDVLRLNLKTVLDDQACIGWQEDGTLAFFDPRDGYPWLYYAQEHVEDDPDDKREDYTGLAALIAQMKRTFWGYEGLEDMRYLLTNPVWVPIEKDVSRVMGKIITLHPRG